MHKFIKSGIAAAVILSTTTAYSANWVDDWFDTAVTTKPGVFESQQRTYATFGSFNGRIKTHSDNLLTISKPHLDVGCGGIDIFMGGFSFLNPDYLVEKAQKMLKVAPYVAFDMALNELCTTCATIKDRAENIINALNGLQMDECKSAKALVVATQDLAAGKSDAAMQTISSGLIQGTDTLWKEASKAFSDNPGDKTKSAINSSDMSSAGKAELLKEGSLLANIGSKMGISATRIDQMRALVGDVQINMSNSNYSFVTVSGCSDATYDALITNTPYQRGAGITDSCVETSGSSIQEYVDKSIDGIADKIQNNKTLSYSASEKSFIDKTPLPIIAMLNTGAKYGETQLVQTADRLKPIAARAYAFYMFVDLVRNISDATQEYSDYLSAATGKQFDTSHIAELDKLKKRAEAKREEAIQHYEATSGDMNNMYQLLDNFQKEENVINAVVKDNKFALGRVF